MNHEDTDFPAEYLVNQIASKPARFTQKTGLQINIDFGSSQKCNCIAILGHNLSSGATITIQNDDNSGMSSPDLNQALTWNEDQIVYLITSNDTNRYWRISIEDSGNSSYPMIGELILGEYIEFSQNFDWNIVENVQMNLITHKTDFQQTWSYFMNKTRSLGNMNFTKIDSTTLDELLTMFEDAKGSHYPILLIWDDNNVNRSIYGKLGDQHGRHFNFVTLYSVTGLTITGLPFAKELDDD